MTAIYPSASPATHQRIVSYLKRYNWTYIAFQRDAYSTLPLEDVAALNEAENARNALNLEWHEAQKSKQRLIPLRVKMGMRKQERIIAKLKAKAKRLQTEYRTFPTTRWHVWDEKGVQFAHAWSTRKLLIHVLTKAYHLHWAKWDHLALGGQQSRITNFAKRNKFVVEQFCDLGRYPTATAALNAFRRGEAPDPRRWTFRDDRTFQKLHPAYLQRVVVSDPLEIAARETVSDQGLTSDQVVRFIMRSGLDPKMPYKVREPHPVTFLPHSLHDASSGYKPRPPRRRKPKTSSAALSSPLAAWKPPARPDVASL